eukprot:m.156607 g.156607  ORF g.156607 m.156607 type:complete len:435 (+) comp17941_c0_seq1:153-1457(+)
MPKKMSVASTRSTPPMRPKRKSSVTKKDIVAPDNEDSADDIAMDDLDGFGADNEDFSSDSNGDDSEIEGDSADDIDAHNDSNNEGDDSEENRTVRSDKQKESDLHKSSTTKTSGDVVAESDDKETTYALTITSDTRAGPRPGLIRNKMKRHEIHKEQMLQKKKDRKLGREKRKREREELGDNAPKTKDPRTIENTREFDETIVDPDDEEVIKDQETDELSSYFDGRPPKIIVTTSNKPVGETFRFAEALINIMPTAEFRPRKGVDLKKIIKGAIDRDYTDIIVVNEDRKKPTGLWICHLPDGPTAHFKLSSIKYSKQIRNHGRQTTHHPEIMLNNFHTRLGHQVGRQINALFPQRPEFQGRSVVTFHNQRDFIFFRFHRYIFKNAKKVGLQELGPRFTLKLRSLQKGTFDTKFGEYEWIHKRKEMDTSRRRFFL